MIDLGPHAAFIVWAYLGVAVALGLLVAALAVDAHRVRRRLADLEARGIRRRSEDSAP